VMEYLEGETLEQRLNKGPLPADQVLRYGIEISSALEKSTPDDPAAQVTAPAIRPSGELRLGNKVQSNAGGASIPQSRARRPDREGVTASVVTHVSPIPLRGRTDLAGKRILLIDRRQAILPPSTAIQYSS
jgi:hypothetical protein